MKIKLTLIVFFLVFVSANAQKKIAGNYIYKTECMGVELDGSVTLKAWGNGRNRADAVEQAKKNAVRDVIFINILEGKQDCAKKALILEVNAEEKYEDYFNKFFADGGEFKNFITLKDERIGEKISRDRKKARESVTHGLIVRVLRSELKSKLIADGIIKQ
ncbi:hypothetical protein EQG63_01355 [Flavobacterium amnicola]|uniref:Uncharacterized protein n=1 Tax=Flavobacterium amnicola TaxID=2506422 RepID=A0A4Q1K4F9_9FLAO|nr:hypothetical protein [Flavobacterium amnicola]RXR20608.1 hypothetical protein EQG63_01355 [Flavobacterium amnicola]